MKVVRATKAGFCMGVSLALDKLENAIRCAENARVCTLGPIIHNPPVLAHFASHGVVCLNSTADARAGDHVLIRAHGITKEEEADLRKRCSAVEDATCPKVKKAQLAIARATGKNAALLLFGEAEHPEVRGLVSYSSGGATVFGSVSELDKIMLDPARNYVLASQTTQDKEIFEEIAVRLGRQLPSLAVLSTICEATRERQAEAMNMAGTVDAMVVVGGRQSGNTRRLAAIAAESGVRVFHIETAAELDRKLFDGCATVGLTAGASTPANLIDEVENWLSF